MIITNDNSRECPRGIKNYWANMYSKQLSTVEDYGDKLAKRVEEETEPVVITKLEVK